ncbi:MAG: YeiH family protein [Haloplanus sp.]
MSVRRYLPGVCLLCLGAVLARAVGTLTGLNRLLVAIALGVVLANGYGIPSRLAPGLSTHKIWLGTGIVLMGASLTLGTVLDAGPTLLLVILVVAGTTMLTVELLAGSVFGLGDRLGSLLAAGSGICGVSAVVAVSGAIRAREEQIAYAAATVLLFDSVTLVVYPMVGHLLGLSDVVFGIWAGVSMFSTGPVVAVGFAHSATAGQWATVTKLSRNVLIGVVVLGYASYYSGSGGGTPSVRTLWDEFPKFVFGFLALVAVSSAGLLSAPQRTALEHGYDWLFLLAFVGLGTEIRLEEFRSTGVKPALVVLAGLCVASILSLVLLTLLF